jgi:aminoglycoside phosphotransferase (APT) family kinase protein
MTIERGPLVAVGRTAEVYAWGEGQVLKLFFDWCPAHWAEREARAGRVVSATALPTPRLYDAITLDGRRGLVYERVEGAPMLRQLAGHPWRLPALARQLADVQNRIRRESGAGLPPVRASLEAAISSGGGAVTAGELRPRPLPPATRERVLEVLRQLPDGTALCHGDLHPDQVLLTPLGPVIIDWMAASQGDPAADVARTALLLALGQPPRAPWLARVLFRLAQRAFLWQYLRHSKQLLPAECADSVDAWMIPVAAARLQEGIAGEERPILAYLDWALRQ